MENLAQFKKKLKLLFEQNNIPLDEVDKILCEVLNVNYSKLFLLETISHKDTKKVQHVVKKRLGGMPLTKIFRKAYFYGLLFKINKHVLSPRQETELIVEQVLKRADNNFNILDVCTGSGAISVVLAKNGKFNIDALDVSVKALKVAKFNAKYNNVKVNFFKSDMFQKVNKIYDVIVSNPPYIPTQTVKSLGVEVKNYDPLISLDGGQDGLDFYRILATQSPKYLKNNGYLVLEIGFDQRECVEKLLKYNNFDTMCLKDYSLNDRVIIGKLKKV